MSLARISCDARPHPALSPGERRAIGVLRQIGTTHDGRRVAQLRPEIDERPQTSESPRTADDSPSPEGEGRGEGGRSTHFMNWPLLQNSLLVAGTTTALAVVFGFVAALWLATLEARCEACFSRWRSWRWRCRHSWSRIAGSTCSAKLECCDVAAVPDLFPRGTIWILALMLWPIALFAMLAAWRRLSAQFECEPALTGLRCYAGCCSPWRAANWFGGGADVRAGAEQLCRARHSANEGVAGRIVGSIQHHLFPDAGRAV